MELVKNKVSGKFFIVIDDAGENYMNLITPEGRIKRLESHLFSTLTTSDYSEGKINADLTRAQMETYKEHSEYADF